MCGIAGSVNFKQESPVADSRIKSALSCLSSRGPDAEGIYQHKKVTLGHRRLSIIDTSAAGNQPMSDSSGRYTIIFNGEFFNYREHRNQLIKQGINFQSGSDTEVLMHLYIRYGPSCLEKVNGFFAFCIYDKEEQTLFLARDRAGIKPLHYYKDENHFYFASENKSLLAFGIPREIDYANLHIFFQLNYLPGETGMMRGVRRLQAGHYLMLDVEKPDFTETRWYELSYPEDASALLHDYSEAKNQLQILLEDAVKLRLEADVPLGCFLSGGMDSSIITALASRHKKGLHTFSIGFSDEPAFDETMHAEIVANHCKTNHRSFRLTTDDLLNGLTSMLDYLDEPFADSSALAVNILSRETKKHVTVSLSGDGADELFGGYRKHRAEFMIRHHRLLSGFAGIASPLLRKFEGSRQNKTGNRLRQLHRFAEGAALTPQERYWRWCSISTIDESLKLIKSPDGFYPAEMEKKIRYLTRFIKGSNDINEVLYNDVMMVLPYDMLVKTDMMSMASGLEVRVPFLDYRVMKFAFGIPDHFKLDSNHQKKILKDSFSNLLPEGFFNRQKQGFEVPLLRWFRTSLKGMLDDLLNENHIREQGIFNFPEIKRLRNQLMSAHPADATGRIWALIVFQSWYRKHYLN